MIIDLQRRIAEVGRIRIGQQVAAGRGKKRPEKLTTFRLTSPARVRIEQASRLYGGDVAEWEAPAGKQFEVITKTDVLPVIVPPSDMAFSQWYELWSGGGCQRRCDGATESIGDQPCVCDPEKRECKIHTRLSVMLRDMPGLGLWRIDTSGWYAALELQGAVDVMQMAAAAGKMLPAALRLEQRMIKRANDQTKRFAVPVLDVEISPAQLLGRADPLDVGTLAIEPDVHIGPAVTDGQATVYLTPVPESVPERPTPSVREQATAEKPAKKPRKNAAKKIAPTGVKPRTAAEYQQQAPPPEDDYEDEAQRRQLGAAGVGHSGDGNISEKMETTADRAKLNRNMHALFNTAGLGKEKRDERLTVTAYLAKRFDVQSSNDLTDTEMQTIVDKLNAWDRDGVLADQVQETLNDAALDAWQGQQEEQNG
jgi:hypothetical protein